MVSQREPLEAEHDSHAAFSLQLDALQRGDAGAWSRFLERYSPTIARRCRDSGVRPQDVADLVQNVLLRVIRYLGRFEPNGHRACFLQWLRKLTASAIADHFRTAVLRTGLPAVIPDSTPVADTSWASLEASSRAGRVAQAGHGRERLVWDIRRQCSAREWTLLWRTLVDERPTIEVAEELGMTAIAVRKCKSRLLEKFRERWRAGGGGVCSN